MAASPGWNGSAVADSGPVYSEVTLPLSGVVAEDLYGTLALVTSLKRVKSKTTLPYIELFIIIPAKPTTDVGMSCLLDRLRSLCPFLLPSCRSSSHLATSLLTKDPYAPVL